MKTGSNELMRDMNQKLVLQLIINKGPLSRASIARDLGLTKATVSAIAKALMEQELIEEIGCDDTALGRKPILVRFRNSCGLCLSIDLAVDAFNVLLSDLSGNPKLTKQYPNQCTRKTVLPTLIQICRSAILEAPKTPYGIVGIAVGIHGVVWQGSISFTPYYPYENLDLASELSNALQIPVYIENEANLSVLAERTYCYDYPTMAGISIHSGAGLGLIINNRLFYGHNGFAGEFGHTIIEVDGRSCPCGNHGCLEQYVSRRALFQQLAHKKGVPHISMEEFLDLYELKDADALAAVQEFIRYMTVGINNILYMYNPDIIVINSEFTMYLPDILPQITSRLSNSLTNRCLLAPSGLKDVSILLGGAALCTLSFLKMDALRLTTELYTPSPS